MADRFFSTAPLTGDYAFLDGAEAHHLTHVLRAKPGAEVVLFDGSGMEATARIESVSRSRVELAVVSRQNISRERPVDITVTAALPKGDRQRWLVEKLVEFGVRRLVPLTTRRSVAEATPGALDRLRRAVIEACKQSGRNRLMEIAPPVEWASYAAMQPFETAAAVRWLAHPGGEPLIPLARQMATAPQTSQAFHLAVGPEGGFIADEVAAGRGAGWRVVDLGPSILRVETAALFLVAAACIAGDAPADVERKRL